MASLTLFFAWVTANWGAISGVIAGAAGIYKSFTAFQKERAAKISAQQSLSTVVTALELQPANDPAVIQAKDTVRRASQANGTDKEIHATVQTVKELMRDRAFLPERDETDPASVERAAKAIIEARKQKASAAKIGVLLVILVLPSLMGCQRNPIPIRMTNETVWPATIQGALDTLVVEWPSGIKAADIVNVDVESLDGVARAQSVVEMPKLEIKR